jgi:hypothetical protein
MARSKQSRKTRAAGNAARAERRIRPVHPAWIVLGLFLLTFAVYLNSLDGDWVFDDAHLVQNTRLASVETLGDAVSLGGGRPLTLATYGLNVLFGGMDPWGFHLVNVLIHALNVILVFFLLMHLSQGQRVPAALGALMMAVHPLFTEAVANVSARYSLLCGTFYFLAVLTFFKGLDAGSSRTRISWFVLTAAAGVLAWNAKQEALALPVALAALV